MSDIRADNNLRVRVALGLVPGWRNLRKFGMNPAVTSGTENLWPLGTVVAPPTSAAVVSITSDSAEDDPNEATPPGTGAWTVTIEGLDGSYNEITETVTMTGATPVVTTQTFLRVNRAYVVTAGSTRSNVGNITGTISGGAVLYIEAGEGQTHQTMYCVPAGHSLIVDGYTIGVGRMAGTTDLHVLSQVRGPGTDTAWRSISDVYLYNGQEYISTELAEVVPEKYDIRQQIVSDVSTQVFGIYVGYLVKNDAYGV